jgi:hypothetical protein
MSFSLHVPVPCIRGHFGRDVLYTFQTQVHPEQIINLLGHDPRHQNWPRLPQDIRDLYSKIQRKTSASRRDSVEGYLEDRFMALPRPGAFPSICIGMTQPPNFQEGNGDYPDMGLLKMDLGPQNIRILLDGLGRVSGSVAFLENNPTEKNLFTLPVTIFAPHEKYRELKVDELGQLFFDFNFRVNPISKAHALRLDQSDIYLVLCNKLGKSEILERHGGMEIGRQSLGTKSKGVVVQQVLLRFVRGACEGGKFQKSNNATVENPNLTRDTFTEVSRNLESFVDIFAEKMGDKFADRNSLHLTSVGWQALGLTAHDLYFQLPALDSVERMRIVKEMADLDWTRQNKDMLKIGVLSEVDGQIGLSGRGVAAVEALHDHITEKTPLGNKLKGVMPITQSA